MLVSEILKAKGAQVHSVAPRIQRLGGLVSTPRWAGRRLRFCAGAALRARRKLPRRLLLRR